MHSAAMFLGKKNRGLKLGNARAVPEVTVFALYSGLGEAWRVLTNNRGSMVTGEFWTCKRLLVTGLYTVDEP